MEFRRAVTADRSEVSVNIFGKDARKMAIALAADGTVVGERELANAGGALKAVLKPTYVVDLVANEGVNSAHVLSEHIGLTQNSLLQRFVSNPNLKNVSTFSTKEIAEREINNAISKNLEAFDKWLKSAQEGDIEDTIIRGYDTGVNLGFGFKNSLTRVDNISKITVVFKKVSSHKPNGFVIYTAFPEIRF